jgi:hypothetical protein
MFDELNEDNYLFFAIKNYNNPQGVTKEDFFEDMNRFKYVKRLFKRYVKTGELKVHLILNHIILIYNLFDEAATPLLLYKLDNELSSPLKTFLTFIDRWPPTLLPEVQIDEKCRDILESI